MPGAVTAHPSVTAAAVFAHQGGWDESLMVLAPMLAIVAALAVVKRRVDRRHPNAEADDAARDSDTGTR